MVILLGQEHSDELASIDHQPERWEQTVPTNNEQKWINHVLGTDKPDGTPRNENLAFSEFTVQKHPEKNKKHVTVYLSDVVSLDEMADIRQSLYGVFEGQRHIEFGDNGQALDIHDSTIYTFDVAFSPTANTDKGVLYSIEKDDRIRTQIANCLGGNVRLDDLRIHPTFLAKLAGTRSRVFELSVVCEDSFAYRSPEEDVARGVDNVWAFVEQMKRVGHPGFRDVTDIILKQAR